ncbi:hypothetical protein CRG98_046520 [Punica granatum]|uniref:Uncharacterized protein n=1 Tax=Punica granatum TaxID=22663 RepID=A0A2I0HMY6_PUNGR|nr:hypothetical protein CRG98_046520 [Punica granatum]
MSLKEYMWRVPEGVHADKKSGDPKSLKQYMRTRSPGTGSPYSCKCGPEVPKAVKADTKSGDSKSLKQ